MFIWDFAAGTILDALLDWVYSQIVGFLGNFFAVMGSMGVELFELDWVQSIILFFSRLAWALFAVSLVVSAFECGIEYASGRANIQQTALNILKGFFAVSLFSTLPVRLYELSVTLQGTFAAGLTGYGSSIGEVGKQILHLYKQFAGVHRVLRMTGTGGDTEFVAFSKSDISADDVQFAPGYERTAEQKKEDILSLLSLGLLQDGDGKLSDDVRNRVLEALGFGSFENARDISNRHLKKA